MKALKEFDLLVSNNLLLGKLLFIIDAQKRLSLKLSLGYKVSVISHLINPDRYNPLIGNVFSKKITPTGSSIEYSYKFADQKLEMKNEIGKGSIERSFYDINIPATSPLLLLRLSKPSPLKNKAPYLNPLIIDEGLESKSLVVSLSFPGKNGKPWFDELMTNEGQKYRYTEIKVPIEIEPSKLFILASIDTHPRNDGLSIWIPETHKPTKISNSIKPHP